MTGWRAAVAVAVLGAVAVLTAQGGGVQVKPIVTADGRVLVSFAAPDAFSIEVREVLAVGTVVTFAYDVELRRPVALWADALLAQTSVRTEAKYDTLLGGYTVSRLRDGRIVRTEKRGLEADVREWLTTVEPIELDPRTPLRTNQDYYVQVRLTRSPRRSISLWAMLPGGREDAAGRAEFIYLR